MQDKPWGVLVGVRPGKQLHKLLDRGFTYEEAFCFMHREYGVKKEKFDLLWRVCQKERPILKESSHPDLFSIYIGVPFCPTRCLYCSFPSHSLTELGKLRERFVESLLYEIKETGFMVKKLGMSPYTIYLGGGTPTSLSAGELDRVISALEDSFPKEWREFTVEAGRPDTITPDHMSVMKKHRVSRISVNPQTMHEKTLKTIGRCHSIEDIKEAAALVRQAGIPVLNMDLIVGLPNESAAMVEESVRQVLAFSPENITVHIFSRKRASRFNEQKENYLLPDEHEVEKMQHVTQKLLEQKYQPYYLYRQRDILGGLENIGYTRSGSECAYNIVMIEERHHILGLGGGATTKVINPDLTLENIASPKDVRMYFERLDSLLERREIALTEAITNKNNKNKCLPT